MVQVLLLYVRLALVLKKPFFAHPYAQLTFCDWQIKNLLESISLGDH